MSSEIVPKTVALDFGSLPEEVQKFHLSAAKHENRDLGDELLHFIKVQTRREQDLSWNQFLERAKATQERLRAMGVSMDIPWVREQFDDEGDDEF